MRAALIALALIATPAAAQVAWTPSPVPTQGCTVDGRYWWFPPTGACHLEDSPALAAPADQVADEPERRCSVPIVSRAGNTGLRATVACDRVGR